MKIDKMHETLKELNPEYVGQFCVVANKIRMKTDPEKLMYPSGYYFNSEKKVITNKGKVPFWKNSTFKVSVAKHKRM